MRAGATDAGSLLSMVKKVAVAVGGIAAVKKVIGLSDELSQTTARLNLMNDGLQTTADLQRMIFSAAQRSRGEYQTMADSVSKMGMTAKDAFSSNKELVAFMEQVSKQFAISGASSDEIRNSMIQLTQAMGSGVLRGDELNSIFEQAPTLIQTIASYLDVPIGKIRDLASEGELTADIVKNAMLWAADETNAKFAEMPMTFAQIWTSFKNYALMAFQPVLQRLNDLANSEAFQTFVQNAIGALVILANIAIEAFNWIAAAANWVSENIGQIAPAIMIVAGALLTYKAITLLAAAAQVVLNAAQMASPVMWIVLAFAALVGIICAVIDSMNLYGEASTSIMGVVVGIFLSVLSTIGNVFIGLWNLCVEVFAAIWNVVATVANGLAGLFIDPVNAIIRMFAGLADAVLGTLQGIAEAIDAIFGSNLASAVKGWRSGLGALVDEKYGKGPEIMQKADLSALKLDRIDAAAAFESGYQAGNNLEKSFSTNNLLGTLGLGDAYDDFNLQFDPFGYEGLMDGLGDLTGQQAKDADKAQKALGAGNKNGGKTAENTKKMADSMDMLDEDLVYLRDLAERRAINRFTLANRSVNITNNNNVASGVDADRLVARITDQVWEVVDTQGEGIHT